MISQTVSDNPKNEDLRSEATRRPDASVSSSPVSGQQSRRRDTRTTSGSVIPEESRSIPEESRSVIPEESRSVIPEESRSIPEESRSIPEESRSIPEESRSVIPEESRSVIPEESRSIPEESRSVIPEESRSIIPEESRSVIPEESRSVIPEESRSVIPEESRSIPEESRSIPEESRSVIPEESRSVVPEESRSIRPLVADASIMTSGEMVQTAPLLAHMSRRSLLYKTLCFLLLILQGGVLDFYLIVFTDLSWCSWIATDLVVVSGWGLFFMKNARTKKERACGFHQKSSIFGCNLGEFTYAYLAWLFHVISCTPKVVLILETSLLELIALRVPCGATGLRVTVLLSVPLLFCLINAVVEDLNGPTRHRAHSCFLGTCLDLLDSFTLLELLLRNEVPTAYLRYTVISVYFVALAVPVIWLYELTASGPRCWPWLRFSTELLVNAPLLVVRCLQVYVYNAPASVFMFKNIFFVGCQFLELLERVVAMQGVRRRTGAADPAQFSHCVSDNDMCPHRYVNTLTVTRS